MAANRDTLGGGSGGADASGYSLGVGYYGITPSAGGNVGYASGFGPDTRSGGNWNSPATAAQYNGWLNGTLVSPFTGQTINGIGRDVMAMAPPSWATMRPVTPEGLLGPTPGFAVPQEALAPQPMAPAVSPLANMPTLAGAAAPVGAGFTPAQAALLGKPESVVQKYDPANEAGAQRLAKMSLAEARGEGALGMQAVMNTAVNRAEDNWGNRGTDPVGQAYSPAQYSGLWDHNAKAADRELASDSDLARMAVDMGREAMAGNLVDITGGARSFRVADQPTDRVHRDLEAAGYTDIGSHRYSDFAAVPTPVARPADLASEAGAVRSWANPVSVPYSDPGFERPGFDISVFQGVPLADITPRRPSPIAGAQTLFTATPDPADRRLDQTVEGARKLLQRAPAPETPAPRADPPWSWPQAPSYDPLSSVRAPAAPDTLTFRPVTSERITPPSYGDAAAPFTKTQDRLSNPDVPHTLTATEYAEREAERQRMAEDEAAQMTPMERARRNLGQQLTTAYQQDSNPWSGQPNDPRQTAIALGQVPGAPPPAAPQEQAAPVAPPVAPIATAIAPAAVPLPPVRPTMPERPVAPERPAVPRLSIEADEPPRPPADIPNVAPAAPGVPLPPPRPDARAVGPGSPLEGAADKDFHKTPLGMGLTFLANAIAGAAFPPAAPLLAASSVFGVNPFQLGLDYMTGGMAPQKVTEPLPDFGRGRGSSIFTPAQQSLLEPVKKTTKKAEKEKDEEKDPGILLPSGQRIYG